MYGEENGFSSVFIEEDISSVAQKVIDRKVYEEEAFFVCDVRDIQSNISLWQQQLPCVKPYYNVSCCSDLVVLRTLSARGVNFACGSKHEMQILLESGVGPDSMLYNSTTKCGSHLKYAEERGLRLMCFDSAAELARINDTNARLLLRLAMHDDSCQSFLNDQFGCSLEEATQLLRLAKTTHRIVVGVSFHMGEISVHDEAFVRTVQKARAVFDLGLQAGFPMTILDIGGGFPIASRKEEFVEVCRLVRLALGTYFPSSSGTTLIAEPGRFFVASAFTLVTKVVGKRKKGAVANGECEDYEEVFINESKYNSIPRDASHLTGMSLRPLVNVEKPRSVLTAFWAATSNPRDLIFDTQLFWPLQVNDWLLMDNVGAYSLVLACAFNGSGTPPVVYVASANDADIVKKALTAASVCSGYTQLERAIK
ncbi:ornithine decarboxylase-like [Amblyomma americanum]